MTDTKGFADLRVKKEGSETFADGAVARLRYLDGGRSRSDVEKQALIVPVGDNPKAKRIALNPGNWSIEIDMPDGQLLQKDFQVIANQTAKVELETDASPRETLSWAQYVGAVESKAEYYRPLVITEQQQASLPDAVPHSATDKSDLVSFRKHLQRARTRVPALEDAMIQRNASVHSIGEDIFKGGTVPVNDKGVEITGFLGEHGEWSPTQLLNQSLGDHDPNIGDPVFFRRTVPVRDVYADVDFQPSNLRARAWVLVEAFGERSLLVVPCPWTSLETSSECSFQVVTHLIEGKHGLARMVVNDASTAAIIGYMTSDRMGHAAVIAKKAEDLLFRKVANHFSAAAGGYILLATRLNNQSNKDWHNWIGNLAHNFPTLPDGAILEGTLRLTGPKAVRDFDLAAEMLSTAFDRGIPFYTLGLLHLRRGLSLLAGRYPDLEEKLEKVVGIARLAEPATPFTTLRLEPT